QPYPASVEALWRNADDGEIALVEPNRLPDQSRISRESPLPQPVTDDHYRMSPWRAVFIRSEGSSQRRAHGQYTEEIARDQRTPDTFGLPFAVHQVEGFEIERGQPTEDFVTVAIFFVIGVRDRNGAIVRPGQHTVQHDQPIACRHAWQR